LQQNATGIHRWSEQFSGRICLKASADMMTTLPNGDEKRTLVFKSPADVRDTRFLNINYDDPERADEQYIYLPALRKVRTIGVQGDEDKTAAFLGSDFTYADMGELEIEDFESTLVGRETVNRHHCYVIEMISQSEKVIGEYGYSKIVRYINTENFTAVMNVYYGRDHKKAKRLVFEDTKKVEGYWLIGTMKMTNLQNDHKTVLVFEETDIKDSISDKYFTLRFLQRGR
jgi:hypothetical protein